MPVLPEEIRYYLLNYIERNPHATQRELASELGISLGKLNYCLKALIDKGWIKAGRFYRSSRKREYAYLLTPQGLETKARLTATFLQVKMKEYDQLRREIETLQEEIRGGQN